MQQGIIKKDRLYQSPFRWIYVVFGSIIMMCLGTVYSYSILRHSIEQIFQVSTTQSGLPYMASLACYALFMMLTGRFLDKYHPRFFILLGGGFVALGWILSYFATNIYMLTFTYGIISGAGVGIAYGAPIAVVAKWFPEIKGLAVGIVLVGFGLSPLITGPVVGSLLASHGTMRTFLILGVFFGSIIALLSIPFKYPSAEAVFNRTSPMQNKGSAPSLKTSEMISAKSFKGLYINFIIGSMIGLTLIGLTNSIGRQLIGLPMQQVIFLMSIFAVFNGAGRPVFGWLTDKLSPKKAIFISYALIAVSAVLILFAGIDSLALYATSFALFWFNLGGWLAIMPTATMSMYGLEHYSQNYGVIFTAYGIGAISGVISTSILLDAHGNYDYVFYFVIALCAIGVAVTAFLMDIE
ncbi:MAG: MFS transporter [Clostridia bacterium]|nr:MFS transporter [Clostridia bacterium]